MHVNGSTCVLLETVRFGDAPVPYYFGHGLAHFAADYIASLKPTSILLIIDAVVHQQCADSYVPALERAAPVHVYVVNSSERAKTFEQLSVLVSWALAAQADRQSVVVAMGGGVVGNIAGLLAHLLLRGIRLVHAPTTFMAAFDSVLSIKQAINVDGVKNYVGAFHRPEAILCDASMFSTLDVRDMSAGLSEAVKNALIAVPDQIEVLGRLGPEVGNYGFDAHKDLWYAALQAKRPHLEKDSWEKRGGLVFEYGHTVGHAIEAAAQGRMRHGEAVAIGLCVAAKIGLEMGVLRREIVELHYDLLRTFGLPLLVEKSVRIDEIGEFLRRDNKRGYLRLDKTHVAMVLLRGLGKPMFTDDLPLVPVPYDTVMQIVAEMRS